MTQRSFDLIVVGGGSGGFGTALAAARAGLRTAIIERTDRLGGNANRCGVNAWEPVVGATGYPFEIYRRLKRLDRAVGIYSYGRHLLWDGIDAVPGGEHLLQPHLAYRDTLKRHGFRALREDEAYARAHLHGVSFEPRSYERVLRRMLEETGSCKVLYASKVVDVEVRDGTIARIKTEDGNTLEAPCFVDATGDGDVCSAAGCEMLIGQESRARFDEPSAPAEANNRINGVTLMYRVTPVEHSRVEPIDEDLPESCWWRDEFPVATIVAFPNGDFNFNMLPTMEGQEFFARGYESAYEECKRRVRAHWRWIQTGWPEYQGYRLLSVADAIGVRESRRVVCEYMLTEHDVVAPFESGYHRDTIALADHALDRHGEKGGAHELDSPFSIPYQSLIPRGFVNLLVACRAAGFSSIAASSCRLSRTMMHLGQAAGNAVAIATESGKLLPDIDTDALRNRLQSQHVQLDYPMDVELERYVADE